MQTVIDIFDAFDGPANVARAIGKRTEHAVTMKRRRSIPVVYWPRLIEAAREQGLHDVTYDALVVAHASKKETTA